MRYSEACKWLDLDPTIELHEITLKKAYRATVMREHPDKSDHTNATERFQYIQHAHQYLLTCVVKGRTGINCYEEDDEKEEGIDDFHYGDDDMFHDDDDDDDIYNVFEIILGPNGTMYVRINPNMYAFYQQRNRVKKSRNYNNARQSTTSSTSTTAPTVDTNSNWKEDYLKKKKQEEATKSSNSKNSSNPVVNNDNEYNEYITKQKIKKERDYDDFIDSMYKHAKNKEETRKQQKKQEEEKCKKEKVKMLQIKVKCPEDKRPGDTIQVKNPHNPGSKEKITVKIPQGAKPGKSFPWTVRVVAEEVKRDPDILCSVCSRNITNYPIVDVTTVKTTTTNGDSSAPTTTINQRIALRSCQHYVCSISCLSKIQGKCCLVCNTPNPTIQSLQHLPYMKEFDCLKNETLMKCLLDDYLCYCEVESSNSSSNLGKKKKEENKEKLHFAEELVLKQMKKHYRRVSLKLHPDRNGEEFRPQFDILTKARDIMIQNDERREYFDQMLDIMCKADIMYLSRGHDNWVEKYEKKKEQEKKKEAKSSSSSRNNNQHLRLEGGLLFNTPRKPSLFLYNDHQRLVKVGLPIKDYHQFLTYCSDAIILGSCGSYDDGNEIRLGAVSKNNNCSIDSSDEIIVKLFLPEHGIWDIKWYMKIQSQGDSDVILDTPFSEYSTIDMRSKKQLDLEERLLCLKETAKHRASTIQVMIRKYMKLNNLVDINDSLQKNNQRHRQKIEAQYWELHGAIAKGRSLERRLKDTFMENKKQPTDEYHSLTQVLDKAVDEKTKLDATCQFYVKKDAQKTFKLQVAAILETNDAPNWIAKATIDSLGSMKGGEANRLYQLLIEGKQATSIMFDGPTLSAASKRTDLFSSKQCETLRKRAEDVENQNIAEANRFREDARRKEEEEKNRKEMEAMAKIMPRGTLVKICDLTTHVDLNGTIATFMGVAPNKRYTIGLYDGREVALKKEHFIEWGSQIGDQRSSVAGENNYYTSNCKTLPLKKSNDFFSSTSNSQRPGHIVDKSINANKLDSKLKKEPVQKNPIPQAQPAAERTKRQENAVKAAIPVVDQRKTPTTSKSRKQKNNNQRKSEHNPKENAQAHDIASMPLISATSSHHNSRHNSRNLDHPIAQKSNQQKAINTASLLAQQYQHEPKPAKSAPSPSSLEDELLTFVKSQEKSLKCKPETFYNWLLSEDIASLPDLVEAVQDEDYFHSEMLKHSVKKFKAMSFKKSVERNLR